MSSWSQSFRHQHPYGRNNSAAETSHQYYCPSDLVTYIDCYLLLLFCVSVTFISQLLLCKYQTHTLQNKFLYIKNYAYTSVTFSKYFNSIISAALKSCSTFQLNLFYNQISKKRQSKSVNPGHYHHCFLSYIT